MEMTSLMMAVFTLQKVQDVRLRISAKICWAGREGGRWSLFEVVRISVVGKEERGAGDY
jgi:hypothetical protein